MNAMNKMNRNAWKNLYRAYRVWMQAHHAMFKASPEEYWQGDYEKRHYQAHNAWMDALDAANIAHKGDSNLCARLCGYAYKKNPLAQYSAKELLEARLYQYKGSTVEEPAGLFDDMDREPAPVASWDWSEYRNSPEYGLSAAQIIDLFVRGEWQYGLFGACSRGEPRPRRLP